MLKLNLILIFIVMDGFLTITGEKYQNTTLTDFQWVNEPNTWKLENKKLKVTTDNQTDFWETTWYNFTLFSGHVYGINLTEDFTFVAKIEADFSQLYDQAGLMMIIDNKKWVKTGIEYNDGQPMIGSVLTNGLSDWATGVFTGDPKKFWIRLTRKGDVVCIKYSTDNTKWRLLRLCPFPRAASYFVGLMCCSPTRMGLEVQFSDLNITEPDDDILHNN